MDFDINRRTFLNIIGGAGFATFLGCGSENSTKRLVSHLIPPEEIVPGTPTWYASVCGECPAGCGIVVATREGRPIKIEGNPLHPTNRGALCARGQAALQGLYHPDRVMDPLKRLGDGGFAKTTWDETLDSLCARLRDLEETDSLEQAVIVVPRLSGSMARLFEVWKEEFRGVKVQEYEAISYEPIVKASEICFGRRVLPRYRIEEADLVVSFGADFLETWISPVQHASAFATMRSYRKGTMGRLLYIGSRLCLTAANADEVILIKPGTYGALVLGMINVILEESLKRIPSVMNLSALEKLVRPYEPVAVQRITDVHADTVRHLARVIAGSPRCVTLPGGIEQSGSNATRNTVAVNLLNFILGAIGDSVEIPDGSPFQGGHTTREFPRFIDRMRTGKVRLAIFSGVNPAHTLPPSSGFLEALRKVETVVCCAEVFNEMTKVSDYVLPLIAPLESWGDVLAEKGRFGLMQPTVKARGQSKHFGEVLFELVRRTRGGSSGLSRFRTFYEFLVETWKEFARNLLPEEPFEEFWEAALRRGGFFSESERRSGRLSKEALEIPFEEPRFEEFPSAGEDRTHLFQTDVQGSILMVYPSLLRYDGRGANRPWLQEIPDPMLQNVWSSCVEVPEATARKMKLRTGDVLRVTSAFGAIECPVYISNHAYPGAVAIALGQGHRGYGKIADRTGVNPVDLLPYSFDDLSGIPAYLGVKVLLAKTGRREMIPTPQGHPYDENRGIVQSVSLASLMGRTTGEEKDSQHPETAFEDLLDPHEHPKHRWGMVIDLNACIGCSACSVACYAENNIPIVGKEQYLRGREMGWIRIERFFNPGRPGETRFIPMLCQHCDYAPCEPVCPVYATYHTDEGLNAQIYNRCVGTRYCANNCPYSVRRFNWFTFPFPKPFNEQLNPDVTVRSQGVMEKCTFCIQRIVRAKDKAKDEHREVKDGEVIPACAQTCPTRAILFGDLKDPESEVSRKARDTRNYRVFEHLNTKPAITYLKKISTGIDIA